MSVYGQVYSNRCDMDTFIYSIDIRCNGLLWGYQHTFFVVGPSYTKKISCIANSWNSGSFKYKDNNGLFEYTISGTC